MISNLEFISIGVRTGFLLVVSFASPTSAFPNGSTYSMLPALEGKWSLTSVRQSGCGDAK